MKTLQWLANATSILTQSGIQTARLDCLVLLEDVTGRPRPLLLAHPEEELTEQEQSLLDRQIVKRAAHIPLSYIRGKTEFYGREFIINEHVLEPRPESEAIIEELLRITTDEPTPTIIDVGTGSGALAVTAKLESPTATVYGLDIDKNCLEVARQNAQKHTAKITLLPSNLLNALPTALPDQSVILLCNLPYVPTNFQINRAALHEPEIAIYGGLDGLDYYRELFEQIARNNWKPKCIITESLPPQHTAMAHLARHYSYALGKTNDFIQVFESM